MVEGARLESVYRGDSIVGSNPTVSATHPIISKTCVEIVGLPTFLPTFSRELVTDCLAPNKYPPHPLQKTYPTGPHRGGTPLFWLDDGTHSCFLHNILRIQFAALNHCRCVQ